MLPPKWFVHSAVALGAIGGMLLFLSGHDSGVFIAVGFILLQVWLVFP